MANLVEIVVRAKDDTKAGLDAAKASSEGLGAKLQKIGMIGGAALGAVAVASVVMAAKFDSSMEMIHTQAGVAQNQIAGLKSGVLALAGKVGFSPDSLAEALYHIESSFASVGIKGPEAMNLLKVAAEGAAVGHANLVDVTNALDAAIASGIPGVKNMNQAMGVLNATVGSGDMHMQDLADAFGTGVLAVVKGFGLSIKDVGAALAVYGDNNIRGAAAGTALRVSVQALAAPMAHGKYLMKDLGISANQLSKDMQTGGLMKAIQDIKTHMDKMGISATQQGQIITEVFGKKAGTGINILVGQIDRLKSKYPDMAKGASQFGADWAATNKTMAQQWKELEASAQALGIQIGEKLMPYAEKLMTFVLAHKSVFVDLAIGIGAVTVALTGLAGILKVIDLVSMLLNPIGLTITAVALLAAGFTFLWKKSSTFRDVIKDIGVAMVDMGIVWLSVNRDIVVGFLTMVSTVVHAAADAFGWVPGLGSKLKTADRAVSGFKDSVSNDFNSMIGTMQGWRQGLEYNASTSAAITAKMKQDFANQKSAAEDAKTGIVDLTLAIQSNGAHSDEAKAARAQLIKDLTTAGVNATTAQRDVDAYSKAVQTNGANSSQAAAARKQLINDILAASKNAAQGAKDLATYTSAVKTNGANSDAAKSARAQLIKDLENCGLSAKAAGLLVQGLTTSLGKVPKSTKATVSVFASGSGGMTFTEKVASSISAGGFSLHSLAGGGLITDGTTPTADDVPILVSKDETVVSAAHSKKLAGAFAAVGVPGYASGGIVGMAPWAANAEAGFAQAVEAHLLKTELAHLKASVHKDATEKASAAANVSKSSGGGSNAGAPGGGSASANAALARRMYPQWASGANWTAWNNVAMRESGWNNLAHNPGGAFGIAQALGHGVSGGGGTYGNQYGGFGLSLAGDRAANNGQPGAQIQWMADYMATIYHGPIGAWNKELSAGFYGAGGATSAGWAMVGEHGRELIKVPGGAHVYPAGATAQMTAGGAASPTLVQLEISGGQSAFDQFMLKMIREQVRVKGGGNVQKAFGKS